MKNQLVIALLPVPISPNGKSKLFYKTRHLLWPTWPALKGVKHPHKYLIVICNDVLCK